MSSSRPLEIFGGTAVPVVFSFVMALAVLSGTGTGARAQSPQEPNLARISAPDSAAVLLGDLAPMGKGTIRSWVRLDENDNPRAVGVTFTKEALKGLPTSLTPGIAWKEYLVDLPAKVKEKMPFDHVGVNWYPEGHIPKGIYDVPHFDVNLFMITPEERDRITLRGKGMNKLQKKPPAAYLPEDYMYAPQAQERGVGAHWVDPNSPEFHGGSFTHTFFFGSYDGEVIFWELMVTTTFLDARPDTTLQIKQPEKYPDPGYYPTSYSIRYDSEREEYAIAFGGMTRRTGKE